MIQTEIGKDGDLRGIAGFVWPLLQRWKGRPIEEGCARAGSSRDRTGA